MQLQMDVKGTIELSKEHQELHNQMNWRGYTSGEMDREPGIQGIQYAAATC